MAAPPAKKLKMTAQMPIVFTRHGMKPDTLLKVFGLEFHVHSVVLKINSKFFHKFMDPDNGVVVVPPASSPFKYEWYTKIDDGDKDWCLSAQSELRDVDLSGFKGGRLEEESAFYNVICAIFGHPYSIKDATQLTKMTEIADYYICLQALSNSLSTALFNNPGLVKDIPNTACCMLEVAYKLRHEALFKECFIHVLGPWTKPQWRQLADQKLKDMATIADTKIKHKLLIVHSNIIQLHSDQKRYGGLAAQFAKISAKCRNVDGKVLQPLYFRELSQLQYDTQGIEITVSQILAPILENRLELDRSRLEAGEGIYEDFFLCAEVKNIPWDRSKKDW
ncbi:uncharacterized protein BP5553_08407 [Venustampulla echinocandica]|uniref:BTB domain-containing protein n=1 Tax=Venustampulla echinocandica TaxID=2656787 RepID=A0A370TE60_9HELO|nr:uncharacterized protein BP5553_08407 [Venustampulla echinocandica]RDL32968.1 hypothetical protein BP5553_08407 [Venustampulla echinocandica]